MFSMALFGSSQPLPSPRSSEMLMSELGSLLRRSEQLQLERAAEGRRRRSSVDYTWLTVTPKPTYQLSPGETLELQDLCAKIQPSECGPVILRELVMEYEPDVHEEEEEVGNSYWDKQRSKSLSVMTFKSRLRINPSRNPAPSGSPPAGHGELVMGQEGGGGATSVFDEDSPPPHTEDTEDIEEEV
ncbi:protein RD3-like [Huso huso]|uniref:Protein RD3-like n=1 Tax=Huso huso TaxID=61971 RepID=A0ABR0Y1P6_HUSHU